jgi:hypothetical protein
MALCIRLVDFYEFDSVDEHTYTNAIFTTARLLYNIPCGHT